jgi:UDP-N-acetylglucosamine enolpyruvyl transferase
MASFVIEGGHKLHGEIVPQGAKNEVLQVLCATLLTDEEVTIENIPNILDVNNLIQLLRDMGVKVSKSGSDTYTFQADNLNLAYLESDDFLNRCSIFWYPRSICSMLWIRLFPSAPSAAISKAIPARISGEVILPPRRQKLRS